MVQPEDPREHFATLKAQLQKALTDVEQMEKAAAQAALPQTVEQADELEKQLVAALEQVKARRVELRKQKK